MTTLKNKLKALTLGATLAVVASASNAAELRAWNIHVEGYPNTLAMESFAKAVAEGTNGDVTVKSLYFPIHP